MGCSPWGHKESDTIEQLKKKKVTPVRYTIIAAARKGCMNDPRLTSDLNPVNEGECGQGESFQLCSILSFIP